jgi:uncharacterized protein (DUF3820 family)
MLDKASLVKLATTRMPFGKYQGRLLMDLPGPYLLWMAKKGFPSGELGKLLELMNEIDINGLKYLLIPLKNETTIAS